MACVPPPLRCPHGIRPVPGKCCEFECNLREPMISSLENAEKGEFSLCIPDLLLDRLHVLVLNLLFALS